MIVSIPWEGSTVDLELQELATGIVVYKNVLKPEWDLVNRIENVVSTPYSLYKWRPARVGFSSLKEESRRCKDLKLSKTQLSAQKDLSSVELLKIHSLIITSLQQCFSHYTARYQSHPMKYIEQINVVRYGMGEYFKEHSDDGLTYRCTISSVGYPNDDYEGGELAFPEFNLVYKPTAGDFVICPSSFIYRHASNPVLNDKIKYSFVIMSDRTPFAHRNDNPSDWSKEVRDQYMKGEIIV